MKGIVKNVGRSIVERKPQGNLLPREHGNRETTTFVTLQDDKKVEIPEDDIRKAYAQSRITDTLVNKFKEDLMDKEIEYENDEDGNGILVGNLNIYIQ